MLVFLVSLKVGLIEHAREGENVICVLCFLKEVINKGKII
jgi:hypothetical protein